MEKYASSSQNDVQKTYQKLQAKMVKHISAQVFKTANKASEKMKFDEPVCMNKDEIQQQ